MNTEKKTAWFEDWFDSKYYHDLYAERDEKEAQHFLDGLVDHLHIPVDGHLLDLACGQGRHSKYLNALGFHVLGVDLSPKSIAAAKHSENKSLHFKVGDMRQPQDVNKFDVVLNLFTSFGYFDSIAENLKTLQAIHISLKPGGKLIVDFMNSEKTLRQLEPQSLVERNGIQFQIERSVHNHIISKHIIFSDQGRQWQFEERVQALTHAEFEQYFNQTGFQVLAVYGNYALGPFDPETSDRMIFMVQKQDQSLFTKAESK